MKKIILFSYFLLLAFCINAQNFVPNWSFEEHNLCPNYYNQVEYSTGWSKATENINPSYSTDYLNICNNGNFGVPNNTWGYQVASTGNSYMALCTMAPYLIVNYRENIYIQLVQPLQINEIYALSVKVSFTDNSIYATNNIGIKLSTTAAFPINNISHLHSSSVITDKNSWTLLQTLFVADSSYRFLAIGNFYTDANTTIQNACPSCAFNQYGYYIDDICLVPKGGGDCSMILSVEKTNNINSTFYPNPFNKTANLTFNKYIDNGTFLIFDTFGKLIKKQNCQGNTILIDRQGMPKGIYFYQLFENNKTIKQGSFVVID